MASSSGTGHDAATGMELGAAELHHPDDSTLTVSYALRTLRESDHQRIAALLEWLAGECEAVIRQQEREVGENA